MIPGKERARGKRERDQNDNVRELLKIFEDFFNVWRVEFLQLARSDELKEVTGW